MSWQLISFIAIVVMAFAPFWIVPLAMMLGADVGPHSSWAAVPWLIFYTVPAGLVALFVWLVTITYFSMREM